MDTHTETKVCTRCKQEKLKWVDFATVHKKNRPNPQVRPQCRKCRSITEMERRDKQATQKYQKQWREANNEKVKEYHNRNRDANLERFKTYREANKEKMKAYKTAYYSKAENKARRNEKDKQRRREDVVFRIVSNVRTRIHNVLKQNKTDKTDTLLGCTKTQLINWLEYQLKDGLTWSNYGTLWHIDHVIPLAFFDLIDTKQQLLAFNWSNLRPLYATENLSKNDTIVEHAIRNHMYTLTQFMLTSSGYQNSTNTCWSQRFNLGDGENSRDDNDFESLLKWIISSEHI